jgi:hypothetical protein
MQFVCEHHHSILGVVYFIHAILDYALGKNKNIRANSIIEAVENFIKR